MTEKRKVKVGKTKKAGCAVLLFTVAACANSGANYEPIIDGEKGPQYSTDLSECQALAASASAIDEETARTTATGALVAGASSLILNGDSDDLGEAVAVGAIAGLASSGLGDVSERESVVKNCMSGRGYNVIG